MNHIKRRLRRRGKEPLTNKLAVLFAVVYMAAALGVLCAFAFIVWFIAIAPLPLE